MFDASAYDLLNLFAQINDSPGSPQDPNPTGEAVGGTLLGLGFTPLIIFLIALVLLTPFIIARWSKNH